MRFIAAFMVILEHCNLFKKTYDPAFTSVVDKHLAGIGAVGVRFFFVLSGFLITYLLLKEIKTKGGLNIKRFYLKRVLRIWPLYFGVGIFGTLAGVVVFGTSMSSLADNFFHLFLFNINHQLIYTPFDRGVVEILWSVCIEEQYYLVFAPLLLLSRSKPAFLLSLFILIGLLAPYVHEYIGKSLCIEMHKPDYYGSINALLFFGIGGIGALWSSKRKEWAIPKWIQYGLLIVFLIYSFELIPGLAPSFAGLSDLALALGCIFIILSATARESIFSLENSLIKNFGQISYGIYVFHTFIAFGALQLIAPYFDENGILLEIGYPLLVTLLTIGISLISYRYYESPFLRLKDKL